VLGLFALSVYIYGDVFGFFQAKNEWAKYTEWTFFQFSVIAISGTLTVIYFLPLLYVHHDFEAGRQFKNDPKFLRRIGVVIPCHKSAGELGEVLRRVSVSSSLFYCSIFSLYHLFMLLLNSYITYICRC